MCADIELDSVKRYEGLVAAFSCEISSVEWIVNGSALDPYSLGALLTMLFSGGDLTLRNVPLHYSGTTVQCVLTFPDNTPHLPTMQLFKYMMTTIMLLI